MRRSPISPPFGDRDQLGLGGFRSLRDRLLEATGPNVRLPFSKSNSSGAWYSLRNCMTLCATHSENSGVWMDEGLAP